MPLMLCLVILAGLLHPVCTINNCSNLIFHSKVDNITTSCFEYSCEGGPDSSDIFQTQSLSEGAPVVKPLDFTVNLLTTGGEDSQLGVTYQWKVPSDPTIRRFTQGYYLKMQPVGSGEVHCRLFDLRDLLSLIDDANSHFDYRFFPFSNTRTETYIVDLFSLPLPSSQEMGTGLYGRHIITVPRKLASDEDYPDSWITWMHIEKFSAEGTMAVTFGLPRNDSEAKFTQFIIILVNRDNEGKAFMNYTFTKINSETNGKHTFTNVSNGEYRIKITPFDPYLNLFGSCLCWKKGAFDMKICGTCIPTASEYFQFTRFFTTSDTRQVPSAHATTTTATIEPAAILPTTFTPTTVTQIVYVEAAVGTADHTVIATAVVLPIMLVAVIVTTGVMYRRRVLCFHSSSPDENRDNNQSNVNVNQTLEDVC